jgi:hypothetical protein
MHFPVLPCVSIGSNTRLDNPLPDDNFITARRPRFVIYRSEIKIFCDAMYEDRDSFSCNWQWHYGGWS